MPFGPWAALLSFITATVVIVLLMFFLSFAIATAQERVVATMRAHAGAVKQWGARILVVVRVWLILLGVFADFSARFFTV